jgi:uncharacterized protein YyaL (SSP411 family)
VRQVYRFVRIAAADALRRVRPIGDPRRHLDAAIGWLKRAHDMGQGGVSYGYGLRGRWRPPYRETSGYISATFFDVAEQHGDADCRTRAIATCRWLCSVQNADGSIANPRYGESGIVFDTGAVLEAFVRAFRATGSPQFLEAAGRAAQWLVAVADQSGRWTRNTFQGVPHVYNTRTAWQLLSLNAISPHPQYIDVARVNLDWAVERQNASGWFDHCAFRPGVAPFTHTIGYALEGLLGAGLLLDESRYVDAARRGAEAVLRHVRPDGFVPGQIDAGGQSVAVYSCLTGNCQLAAVWSRLYERFGDERCRSGAVRTLRYVMRCQDVATDDLDVRGGIKGSQPLWGGYASFVFPSWAAKFFVDAMLLSAGWL